MRDLGMTTEEYARRMRDWRTERAERERAEQAYIPQPETDDAALDAWVDAQFAARETGLILN